MRDLKPTDDEQRAIGRLRAASTHKTLVEVLTRRLEVHKARLVESDPAHVPAIQGRARELQDILDILTKD